MPTIEDQREKLMKGTLAGLAFLVFVFTLPLGHVFNKIDNYTHRGYFQRQGRVAEAEFEKYKSKLLNQLNYPQGSCDLNRNPLDETCFGYYQIGGRD